MKNLTIIFILFFTYFNVQAQTRINFQYDAAGNQIQRIICLTCIGKKVNSPKNIAQLTNNDLKKFFPEDIISYYPNPVKVELFLKWELTDEKFVSLINVYNVNGLLLKSFTEIQSLNNQNISFQEYSQGIYFIALKYNSGEEKTIKIIKD
jgi:hypothetical protein